MSNEDGGADFDKVANKTLGSFKKPMTYRPGNAFTKS